MNGSGRIRNTGLFCIIYTILIYLHSFVELFSDRGDIHGVLDDLPVIQVTVSVAGRGRQIERKIIESDFLRSVSGRFEPTTPA